MRLAELLAALFDRVYIPNAALNEATIEAARPGAATINQTGEAGLFSPRVIEVSELFSDIVDVLGQGEGEAEALALAKELSAAAL